MTVFRQYKMKDSGVEWIGEIPEHWEVKRLKYVADMLVSNVDKHIKPLEESVRLCNYVDVYKNDFITNDIDFMTVTASKEEIKKFKLKDGDVIITKDSEDWLDIGVPSLVTYEEENLICGYHLAILRSNHTIYDKFLFMTLLAQYMRTQFSVKANGVTRYGISHGAINNTWLTFPLISEQNAIANFLDQKAAQIRQSCGIKTAANFSIERT